MLKEYEILLNFVYTKYDNTIKYYHSVIYDLYNYLMIIINDMT